MFAYAVPQVDASIRGFHLLWQGPPSWVFAPGGWRIQRRDAHIMVPEVSDYLGGSALEYLRQRAFSGGLDCGEVRHRLGPGDGWETITFDLHAVAHSARLRVTAKTCHAMALRRGKTVAVSTAVTPEVDHSLNATGIDQVILVATGLSEVELHLAGPNEEDYWQSSDIATRQLPLRELMPNLGNFAGELAEARSRLLPGETLAEDEFARLADLLRLMLPLSNRRPIDSALFMRESEAQSFTELSLVDPLRAMLPSPRWRRALGLGMVDRDPALRSDHHHHYRIVGLFPGPQDDRVYGFHTVPSATPIPDEFLLDELRLRLPQPAVVTVADDLTTTSHTVVSRRGIELTPVRGAHWSGIGLDGWSLVVDFPSAVSAVVLELGRAEHALTYSAGTPWQPFPAPLPVPVGARPVLTFSSPVLQLRLGGTGFLCSLRLPNGEPHEPWVPLSVELPPLVLADSPRPSAPLQLAVRNLPAAERSTKSSPLDSAPPAARHALGFELTWRPAPPSPVGGRWPDELATGLTEAIGFQVEHRQIEQSGATWRPLLPDDNLILGSQRRVVKVPALFRSRDLLERYPDMSADTPAGVAHSWLDVFDFEQGGGVVNRPLPAPGTRHQYRVRAVDVAGRPSVSWTESESSTLMKMHAPPKPVGPTERTADDAAGPTGVHARVLVQGAPDLSPSEQALLGDHGNVVILRWGWHARQRELDPHAVEFRLYAARKRIDSIAGTVTAVESIGAGRYRVTLRLEEPLAANVSRGLRLDGGYPFEILEHERFEAGSPSFAIVVARVPQRDGGYATPRLGPISLPVHVMAERLEPAAWAPRLAVHAITAETAYQAVFYDLLELGPDHPRDEILLGVSAADGEQYVPDPLEPTEHRRGNEGAIAAVTCQGRWRTRPVVMESPSLDAVPVLVAPEPRDRPIETTLDVTSLLPGTGLVAGQRVRFERASAEAVFRAYRVTDGRLIARVPDPRPGELDTEVQVGNPADRTAIVAALDGDDVGALEDRHAVFLAASHPHRERLYQPTAAELMTLPSLRDTLPAAGARWIYRARRADAAGNLSADAVTLRGIVRVPSSRPIAQPLREIARASDAFNRLRFRVDGGRETRHLLLFTLPAPAGTEPPITELLRTPGPSPTVSDGIRIRLASGSVLGPAVVKVLSDGDVATIGGQRHVTVDLSVTAGTSVWVWACARSEDGAASTLGGPWRVWSPPPPLSAPVLSATVVARTVKLTWPRSATTESADVWIEAANVAGRFERVTPRLGRDRKSYSLNAQPGAQRYRLRAFLPDGRTAVSNEVTVRVR